MKKALLVLLLSLSLFDGVSQIPVKDLTELNAKYILPTGTFKWNGELEEPTEVRIDDTYQGKEYSIVYRYERIANEKEIKKPNKIDPRYRIFKTNLFQIDSILSYGLYRDTGEIEINYSLLKGLPPIGLEILKKESLHGKKMILKEVNEDYFLFQSDNETILCYYENRNNLFNHYYDSTEMLVRIDSSKKFINKKVVLVLDQRTPKIVTIDSIHVLPKETVIVYNIDAHTFRYQLKKGSEIKIYDYNQSLQVEKQNGSTTLKPDEKEKDIQNTPYSRSYYKGPRGGCYYYNSSGKKVYVDHSHCN